MEAAFAALLGAVVGGLLTLAGSLVVERRRERLVARAGVRLIRDELEGLARSMRRVAKEGDWWVPDDRVEHKEWDANKSMLASVLDPTDWLIVNSAYSRVDS